MAILVYAGLGTCGTDALIAQLRVSIGQETHIMPCDGRYIRENAWEEHAIALVMGGGECSTWDEDIQPAGMERIRKFVEEGGRYLGVCAGGYFGVKQSIFVADPQNPLTRERGLDFFSLAIGPLNGQHYRSPQSALAAKIDLLCKDQIHQGFCYYQGGPAFIGDDALAFAWYDTMPKTIAACVSQVGKGRAVLCGLHPEFFWQHVDDAVPASSVLCTQESFRQLLWQQMIGHLFA